MLSLRGLTDRDVDAFYRQPAGSFQIGVISGRLVVLALGRERT